MKEALKGFGQMDSRVSARDFQLDMVSQRQREFAQIKRVGVDEPAFKLKRKTECLFWKRMMSSGFRGAVLIRLIIQ